MTTTRTTSTSTTMAMSTRRTTTTAQTANPYVASKHQEPEDPLLTDLFIAYYCARANKRNTWAQVKFEQRLERAMRECSEDYTREAWVLKLDISGYFMSINRQKLYDIVSSHPALALCPLTPEIFSSPPWPIPSLETSSAFPPLSLEHRKILHYLLSQIIFNDPTQGCRIKGSRSDWKGLPHSKSLFWSPEGCGGTAEGMRPRKKSASPADGEGPTKWEGLFEGRALCPCSPVQG